MRLLHLLLVARESGSGFPVGGDGLVELPANGRKALLIERTRIDQMTQPADGRENDEEGCAIADQAEMRDDEGEQHHASPSRCVWKWRTPT